ncbi:MAG: hypothetical protein WCR55_12465 [Lentisphaerota bacterium]
MSMAILTLLIAASFTFFSSAQNTWATSNSKQETFENARIALDLMSRDLESIYYGEGEAPFWFWEPASALPSEYSAYQNGHIAFISQTPIKPNDVCTSSYFEVKYQLFYLSDRTDLDNLNNEGWLRRSVTGNKLTTYTTVNGIKVYDDNPKYNWLPLGVPNRTGSLNFSDAAFTANSNSSGQGNSNVDYNKLIPYVLDLSFTCDTDTDTGTVIQPDKTTVITNNSLDTCKSLVYNSTNIFPSIVTMSITLLDKSSWDKWVSLCGTTVYLPPSYANEPAAAKSFRESKQTKFNKTVYIGNRGQ